MESVQCIQKSDNTEIMINDEADEVVKDLLKSLKKRYQNNLELWWIIYRFSWLDKKQNSSNKYY